MNGEIAHTDQDLLFLKQLQNRLFDLSRRNRNIYFGEGRGFAMVERFEFTELKNNTLILDVDEDEELYNQLDRLRIKAARNQRELGFHQLKLVRSFMHWTNTRVDPVEKVVSPLVLFSVSLIKERGLKDRFVLKIDPEPEINPFLLRIWSELFGYKGCPEPSANSEEEICTWLKNNDADLEFGDQAEGFTWFMDDQNYVLGNFDFRKMSVIQDFDKILADNTLIHKLTNIPFSPIQRKTLSERDSYNVLPSDPSQKIAISEILSGKSLVLQGPPGTGKSQTITNSIANLIEHGKSVLVVSEKKVALDIVKHRLSQVGLGHLVLSLHDSKNDRKEFIKDLKKSYQKLGNTPFDIESIRYKRQKSLLEVESESKAISRYFEELSETDDFGISLQGLFEEGNTYGRPRTDLELKWKMMLPDYHEFKINESVLDEFAESLVALGYEKSFHNHPLSILKQEVLSSEKGLDELIDELGKLESLDDIKGQLDGLNLSSKKLSELYLIFLQTGFYKKLLELDLLFLLDTKNSRTKLYDKTIKALTRSSEILDKQSDRWANWKTRILEDDVDRALELLNSLTSDFKKFFSFKYRRLSKQIKSNYDFDKHLVKPSIEDVLNSLKEYYSLTNKIEEAQTLLQKEFNISEVDTIQLMVKDLRSKSTGKGSDIASLLLQNDAYLLEKMSTITNTFNDCYYAIKKILDNAGEKKLEDIQISIADIRGCLDEFSVIGHFYRKLKPSQQLIQAIKNVPVSYAELKMHIVKNEIDERFLHRHWLKETGIEDVQSKMVQLGKATEDLLVCNSDYVLARQATRFTYALNLTESSIVKLSSEERELRQKFLDGRRLLEREFGKTRRYKSLRELLENGCLDLVKTFKPVWMMSPHSVAENLDLTDLFDVVIFDEASQVRLEEGITSFVRANSYVIVGDEMQLPPSNFFSRSDDEDLGKSLLENYTSKLGRSTLKWHYRSEAAELIQMNNSYFYNGELIPVPAVKRDNKPVEWCFVENGLYHNRKNIQEAKKVVEILKECLIHHSKSVGIVAFSREQQETVIAEMAEASKNDPVFAELLESAYEYEQEGHYEGLFVKNLESVQGDERDTIIVTVCYGPNQEGKFIQQFGPVSQQGGERRLNVLFSRARKKLFLVSSIVASDITSDASGSRFLSKYLEFAQSMSLEIRQTTYDSTWNDILAKIDMVKPYTLNKDLKIGIVGKKANKLLFNLNQNQSVIEYYNIFLSRGWKGVCYDHRSLYETPELIQLKIK